jgi:hypothetical protein
MIAEKKRKRKPRLPDEPKSRTYVRKWRATRNELSEIRHFVRENKYRNNPNGKAVTKRKAKKIREKLVR